MINAETEEFYEEEELSQEELNNVIELELPKQVKTLKTVVFLDPLKIWTDKHGSKRIGVYGRLSNPDHQLQLLDLMLEAYDDYLLAEVVEAVMQNKLPQKGFNRDFALGTIKGFSDGTKLAVAQGLILEFVKSYGRKIVFLLENDEVISVLCLRDNEKGYSADIEIALRGTLEQRQKAIRYWNKNKDSIFKGLYDIGYRRLYMQSRIEMERLIKVIMRGESPEVFSNCKMLRTGKFNNKVMIYKEYLLNLGVKYK